MPGYLSNRLISFQPASQTDMVEVQSNISTIQSTIVEIQGDIEDLQLNVGV